MEFYATNLICAAQVLHFVLENKNVFNHYMQEHSIKDLSNLKNVADALGNCEKVVNDDPTYSNSIRSTKKGIYGNGKHSIKAAKSIVVLDLGREIALYPA